MEDCATDKPRQGLGRGDLPVLSWLGLLRGRLELLEVYKGSMVSVGCYMGRFFCNGIWL